MTEISDTQLDEITWANSDEGKAAFSAAWAKAKGIGIAGIGTGRVMGIDMADVGAIVWAAHQATAVSEEEDDTEPAPVHLHSWTILDAQEVPPVMAFMTKPVLRTAVLARCTNCGEPVSWLLNGTWTLEALRETEVLHGQSMTGA